MKNQKYIIFISLLLIIIFLTLSIFIEFDLLIFKCKDIKEFLINCCIGVSMSSFATFFLSIGTYLSEKDDVFREYKNSILEFDVERQCFLNWLKRFQINDDIIIDKMEFYAYNIETLYLVCKKIDGINMKFSPILKIGNMYKNIMIS